MCTRSFKVDSREILKDIMSYRYCRYSKDIRPAKFYICNTKVDIYVDCACSKNGTELKLTNFRSLLKHLTPTNYDSIFEHVVNVIFVSTKNLK